MRRIPASLREAGFPGIGRQSEGAVTRYGAAVKPLGPKSGPKPHVCKPPRIDASLSRDQKGKSRLRLHPAEGL